MRFEEKPVYYFKNCGEVNTDQLLEIVRKRSLDLGIAKVIVASETGRSAVRALEKFQKTSIRLIVVTHYPATTWGPKGDIPIGLKRKEYAANLKKLLNNEVKVVQGTRPFAPPSRSLNWSLTAEAMIDSTLELFGAGTKIAVEAAIMATDAGELEEGEQVISCAGTFKGLDTALLVETAYSMNFFKKFEVREVIAKPLHRVKKLPEHKYKHWKGDLDKYHAVDK